MPWLPLGNETWVIKRDAGTRRMEESGAGVSVSYTFLDSMYEALLKAGNGKLSFEHWGKFRYERRNKDAVLI